MKIGVYVGSFNPVHKGHIKIVNYLLDNNILDKIIIIPAGNYWNKQDLIDINRRISMLKEYENDKIIIDTKYNNLKYTYMVMSHIKKDYLDDTLYLVLGADNIINFDKWMNYKELLTYNLIILNRNNIDIKYYLDKLNKKNNYIICNNLPNINISSSEIRTNIINKDYKKLSSLLDKKIIDYILIENEDNSKIKILSQERNGLINGIKKVVYTDIGSFEIDLTNEQK